GNYTTLDGPSVANTRASGINASGQIVGYYSDATGQHGFLYDQGSYITLDAPGSNGIPGTQAYGINASGQIVGSYVDAAGNGHGFLYDQGRYTTLDFGASGINNAGQIVGGNLLFDHGNYTTLDVPGSTWTQAAGINDSRQIVGTSHDGAF